jgi:hypothetical protein
MQLEVATRKPSSISLGRSSYRIMLVAHGIVCEAQGSAL